MKKRSLKKMQDGGKTSARTPIKVSNPNDPRLKAYNDSNDLYNYTMLQKKLEKQSNFVPNDILSVLKGGEVVKLNEEGEYNKNVLNATAKNILKKNPRIQKGLVEQSIPTDEMYGENGSFDIQHPTIKPKGIWLGTALNNDYSNVKPVQPYVLEKKKKEEKTVNTDPRGKGKGYGKLDPNVKYEQIGESLYRPIKKNTSVAKAKPVATKPAYKDFLKTVNPDYLGNDYNLEEAYNKLPYSQTSAWAKDPEKNHLPDTYKKPNHPTFSNESMYYKEGMPAVKWEGDKPIPINQPVVSKPVYTSQKQFYQGRKFMETTGLRFGNYHPEEVEQHRQAQTKTGKRAFKKGGIIKDDNGQWAHPGKITEIGSNNITMQGVNYPVLGISDQGDVQMMYPEQNYKFKGNKVTEYPMMQNGGKIYNPNNETMKNNKYKKGGTVKRFLNKYQEGGPIQLLGEAKKQQDGLVQLGAMTGSAILGSIPNKTVTDANGNVIGSYETQGEATGKGVLSGASAGAALGPVGMGIGALVGGTMGFINQRKEAKQLGETQRSINQNISMKRRLGGFNNDFNTMQTTNDNMYAHGGIVDTDQPGAIAELELQEQMQLPNGDVMGVDGPSHEQGGIEVNVPEGTRVFSDRLKLGNKTFAKHAKSLNNKIAKLDKKPDATSKQNTEMLFNKQLDNLFNTQEEMKATKEETKQRKLFAKGGTIPPSHNGMYPAHNVTIMKHGGLTHYQNGEVVGPYDPSQHVRGNKPFMSYSSGYDYNYMTDPNIPKGSNFTAQQKRMDADQYQKDADMLNKTGMSPQNMAFAAAGLNNIIQNQQINKVNRPRTISNVAFTPGNRPSYVNYSAERAAIDSEATGARRGVQLNSGSYSTQAANLQAIRNQQMMNKGRSFQTQENANRTLDNSYNAQQAAAYNQGVQANLGIDQYNLENQYNFDLWKQGNKMKATGAMGDTVTNMFNNQTSYNNQMDYWNVMKNMYSRNEGSGPSIEQNIGMKKKYGGTIKRSFKK